MAASHPGQEIGGSRRGDDKVRLARQPDMADVMFVVAVEQFGENLAAGESADRKRRDEFLRRTSSAAGAPLKIARWSRTKSANRRGGRPVSCSTAGLVRAA
jgi:hypothetical protein